MKTRKPLCLATAAACLMVLAASVWGDDATGGTTVKNPDICTDPNPNGSCKCESDSTGTSQTENGCVMVRIGLGDPLPASSGVVPYLRVFANDPAPDLYTPAGLRLVMGFSVMHTTGGKTAAGVPRSVVVARARGAAINSASRNIVEPHFVISSNSFGFATNPPGGMVV